ncbi:MAG: hypothetical protein KAR40_06175 [Candidatus Sabulitectum sp.]|nr:hypothetical protein [Candidatus Sabulitectum sp.]
MKIKPVITVLIEDDYFTFAGHGSGFTIKHILDAESNKEQVYSCEWDKFIEDPCLNKVVITTKLSVFLKDCDAKAINYLLEDVLNLIVSHED